jgi:MFS family permease
MSSNEADGGSSGHLRTTLVVCGSYLVGALVHTVPASALPAVGYDLGFLSSTGASIAAAGTFAGLLGKLGCGPTLDRIGARPSLLMVLTLIWCASVLLALTSSLSWFVMSFALCFFAAAPLWPAELVVITERCHSPREREPLVRMLAITSRCGSILGRLGTGALLTRHGWRSIAASSAALGAAATAATALALPAAPAKHGPTPHSPLLAGRAHKSGSVGVVGGRSTVATLRWLFRQRWYRRALPSIAAVVTLCRFEFLSGFYLEETSAGLSTAAARRRALPP